MSKCQKSIQEMSTFFLTRSAAKFEWQMFAFWMKWCFAKSDNMTLLFLIINLSEYNPNILTDQLYTECISLLSVFISEGI